ncbi:protein bassoon isoform X2 [Hemicordylus capensis]|uniref:protein bassoon isoform X2 n=1 Tax=Hemicordylus capensis TaxID=884348 RepID=UPI0023040837|nr:protein bassoon isoform X2 [Hemicordylus capensis]
MGNEASLEGGGAEGQLPPGSAAGPSTSPGTAKPPSAPGSGGQLPPGRAPAAAPGPAQPHGPSASAPRRPDQSDHSFGQRAASPSLKQTAQASESTRETRSHVQTAQQADGPRRTLQVDSRDQRSGRSPSVSPDRGSTPTSPYSVPQIAPLPSSTLCPICKTTELTSSPNQPNFNTCTQCHNKVCNQCGFNPNPHLTEVQEWLCLNCQMQRALGMDMTTAPRSKSQQQLHSPSLSPSHSPAKQPQPQPQPQVATGPEKPPGTMQPSPRPSAGVVQPEPPKPLPASAQKEPHSQAQPKPAAPQEVVRSSPQHQQAKPSSTDPRKTVGDSPAKTAAPPPTAGAQEQPQEGLTGKLFGFGASLLTQASTLMSVQPEATPLSQQSPGKVPPKIVFSDASKEAGPKAPGTAPGTQGKAGTVPAAKQVKAEQVIKPKEVPKARVLCPLCKAEINVGSGEPSNYNTCTTCKQQVCNMCGFNPTPHLVEKNEWLCLNCQTQRLLEGSLGDPAPMPLPAPKQQPTGSPRHQPSGTGQQQRGAPPLAALPQHEPSAPQVRHPSQAKHLRTSEQSKLPTTVQEKKPPAPSEGKPLPKLSEEPRKASESPLPKGKSMATKPEADVKDTTTVSESQKIREQEESSKPYPSDLSRSPQSLSDTGYSSDGISSSQSEITGLVQQEGEQLNETGIVEQSPPSPSELTKLESSMRPLLESKGLAQEPTERGKTYHELREEQRQRPRSLSITPEAFDSDEELEDIMEEDEDSLEWENQREQRESMESSDDFGSKLRHDYVEDSSEGGFSPLPTRQKSREPEMTDEEFMRRQLLEMSAEEDNLEEDEEYDSGKYSGARNGHRPDTEKSRETTSSKRRLPHSSGSIYEEERKELESTEGDDMTASQGGLRRFKTIELNSTNNYGREMEISQEADISLDREPELEMESLTGSPEDRSRGEYSSTLPATTPSYTSGTSPTSISSLEEDSDSSPSRRQRLEEVKQQRKARHRSHGPLLPTIEDSSEEEELREEEELLREQEKMREVEQQRIRSTARKTKRDKEELRAQRRRERSKTPPSNLSPIEDASPTEELRQAAEMEELHRSSCSEYSPSIDSEAEGFDVIASKLYKSGSEYNLPTFMSLYSPTEKTASSAYPSKPLKSAEEAYEEMMRKAEMFQKQQPSQQSVSYSNTFQQVGYRSSEGPNNFEYQYIDDYGYDGRNVDSSQSDYQNELSKSGAVYEEILQTSQNISRMHQSSSLDLTLEQEVKKKGREDLYQEKQFLNAESAYETGPLTPGTSPTQLSAPVSFSSTESSTNRIIPDVRVTQHFAKESHEHPKLHSSPTAPSSVSKSVTMPYTYTKVSSTVTTVVSSPASAPRIYSSPTSLSGPDVPTVSTTSRSYSQTKVTASYGSQTENIARVKGTAEISGPSAREKLQSMTESKTNVPMSSPKMYSFFKSSSPPLSPSSPTQSPTHSAPRVGMPPSSGVGTKTTAEFSSQTHSTILSYDIPTTTAVSVSSPMVAQGTQTPHRSSSPRLARQQSSQEAPFMVITLASDAAIQTKPIGVSSSISPASSPTRQGRQQTVHSYSQTAINAAQLQQEQLQSTYTRTPSGLERAPASSAAMQKGQTTGAADSIPGVYSWGTLPAENISLCRISSIPGTSRVEPGPRPPSSNIVDLRTAIKAAPVIITDQGMDLTSLATESRKYCLTMDQSPSRQSTAIQPLIINLNAQEQPHAIISTATTVSITVASSMLVSQPKQPVVYGDPFQSRMDFGQGTGSPVCLTQIKQVEQAVQTGTFRGPVGSAGISASVGRPEAPGPPQTKFARYNLPNQMTSLMKKDALITQTSNAQNVVSAIPRQFPQDQSSEMYRGIPVELKTQPPPVTLGSKKSQVMMVQMDEIATGPVTKLIKEESPANALDLTGMKPESQIACCDVVYKFPFGGSCTGAFNPSSKVPEKNVGDATHAGKPSGQYYGSREQEAQDAYPYREQSAPGPNPYEEHRFYPHGLFGRLYSSMSDTNLSEMGLNYYPVKGEQPFHSPAGDSAVDLTTMKQSYGIGFTDGGYMGHGMQYGSFSDLRQSTDLLSHSYPMRRYNSASNIYSDYRYSPRGDLANFQEASLAHYSATTAREISRMCAALNSMDQYGGRHTNSPDLLQYGPNALGTGPTGSGGISGQQSPMKPNMMYNPNFPETRPGFGNLAQYNLARLGAIRQLLPSTATVRAADGMIYSTINTPIASTLPITTQPASVLRPMLRGLYRPYGPSNITAVPLASLTRVPLVPPRIPLAAQGLYRYPVPSRPPAVPTTSVMETPMYLGKPVSTTSATMVASSVSPAPVSKPSAPTAASLQRPEQTGAGTREEVPVTSSGAQSTSSEATQGQQQQQPPPPPIPVQKQQAEVPQASVTSKGASEREEKEKEEERQRKQQEHILQFERERVELEKLRQLRLHEELERERVELQRHREKEQMLMHREIQELQSIKHQVLHQQQEERHAQFALQREQLAQQRLQLEQIQQLQQQLQQQLEEQKRQKSTFPPVCDPAGRIPPQAASEMAMEMQRTLAQNGQFWTPLNQAFMATAAPGQDGQAQPRYPGLQRPLTNSASEMSLQMEDQWEASRGIKKRNSMPRLRDAYDKEPGHEPFVVKKITDSSVQTDEEDGEERFYASRRRRTRRSTDCSVQTDEEDNGEWEQPVRRRRSRFSRHSDSSAESKQDSSSKGMASIAIQTISDCSVQTEPDQLHRVSPSIHITTPDPRVEIVRYISAPEKTQRGESLACQTEPEVQPQPGIVVPQLTVPTTITPYSSNIQIVSTGPLDPHAIRQQALVKKKPDPLEIGYQSHLPTDSLSQLVSRQPPKSPQVLYSPVSPLSPHRLLESSFTTSERLNKAHVTPQKHFTADTVQRQHTLPRPIKTMQRSLSDPKPISPTSEESAKDRFSLYQHTLLPGSQISTLQSNTLTRKVKRTLPSPPPEEAHLPLASQAHSQMYMPGLLQKGVGVQAIQVTKAGLLKDIDRDLKLVEHESTKLRKKQAELDEEEKEIDAKLKYLELGINQRKESLLKDRNVRDYPYLRCLGENRDYMSDSELNNLRLSGYESSSLLTRPSTAPSNQYADFSSAQYTSASSYSPYQYTSGQAAPPSSATFQQTRFQPPHYAPGSNGPAQNGFQASQLSAYPSQTTYQTHSFTPSTGYQSELGLQSHQSFRPPYQAQTTYPSQTPLQPAQSVLFQTHADTHTTSQKPRQTSLADLEQKIPTNYEVISNPTVVISAATPEVTYSTTTVTSSYDQYRAPEGRPADRSSAVQSPSTSYSSDSLYTNLEQNIPRNYVMIDDISELTKESTTGEGQKGDMQLQSSNGRHMKEKSDLADADVSSRPCCYSKGEEESEEDMYDHHGPDHRGKSYHRGTESNGRVSGGPGSYYYGDSDYRHSSRPDKHGSSIGVQKHPSKNLAPAVISSKRSKHRKQGMEQKISKFSPIEEAKDVESDLASYTVTTSVSSSSVASRAKKLQDDITYGLKKNVYDQQKYYGMSGRDMMEEDDRAYSGRSRSSGYVSEKLSNREVSSRSRSYERESMERSQKGSSKPSSLSMTQSRGRPPIRTQTSEEESPISPLGKSMGVSRSSGGPLPQSAGDSCSQFCSSHSLPDVQEHIKDVPRTHSYKHEEGYIMDDSHCVVSDSEAYHLGQEETDWFDKPREPRSERMRHYGGHSSSSQKRAPVKHTYHDYDEPPDEDMWHHDDYSHPRHSSSKEHRHHGEYGRHPSSSRHSSDDLPRRSSRQHPRDPGRHESRGHGQPSAQKKAQAGYPSSASDYSQQSRQPSGYHHTSESQKSQRQMQHGPPSQQPKSEPLSHQQQPPPPPQQQQQQQQQVRQQQAGQQQQQQQQQPSSRQPPPSGRQPQQHQAGPSQQSSQQQPQQARTQQQLQQQQPPPPPTGPQAQPSSRPAQQQAGQPQPLGKPQSTLQAQPSAHQAGPPKAEQMDASKPTTKVPQVGKAPQTQPQGTAAGIKLGPKPAGAPTAAGAAAGQPGAEGESVFSKILPGGAAEQAGKLTEAVSAFGKKFTSFW